MQSDPLMLERKIGGTTYIIEGTFSKTATENPAEKIRRIILNELKSNQN